MALPFKSLLGNWVGLTRETTTQRGQTLFSRRGFAGPYLYLHATEPSANSTASIVDLEGFTTVTALATGTAAVATRGIAQVTSGASTAYTLAGPPGPGIRKTFFATSTSTSVRQITSVAQISRGAGVGGDAGTIAASSAFTVLTFQGQGNCIELVSLSTAHWACVSIAGYATGVAALSTV